MFNDRLKKVKFTWPLPILAILFSPLVLFLLPKLSIILLSDLLILSVPDEGYSPIFWFWACLMKVILRSSDFERTWWRLFQKLVVRTKLDIYASIQGCHYNMYIFSYD
jgi:hypothetical protein